MYHSHGLTGNNGRSYSGTILGMVGDDVFALFTKDVDQCSVYTVGKVGVFLLVSQGPSS
jgi:hypothetical protein